MIELPRELPAATVPAGTVFWRVYRSDQDPLWFGPHPGEDPRHRFDPPEGQYRVCYLGDSPEVAVAETLIRAPWPRIVPLTQLAERRLARVPVLRDLRLVRFHGPGLVHLGVGADIAHGHPYATCQELALEFWSHPDAVDGIEYRSRWDNDRLCFAIFDRAAEALSEPDQSLDLGDPTVAGPILELYRIGALA